MLSTTTAAMITTRINPTTPIIAPNVSSPSSDLESFLGITPSVTNPSFWSKMTRPLDEQNFEGLEIF